MGRHKKGEGGTGGRGGVGRGREVGAKGEQSGKVCGIVGMRYAQVGSLHLPG